MENAQEPIDAINTWQEWYRQNELSKSSLTVFEKTKANVKQKIVEYFADTITEGLCDLSGIEIYKCFMQAAQEIFEGADKEYKKTQQLVDCLKKKYD
jgi:hypothetical protein